MNITKLNQLFYQTNAISEKYIALRKGNSFNIFKTLGITTDEVRLHSRLIHGLIQPKGELHQKMQRYFLEELDIKGLSLNNEVVVRREYKNIDLLITSVQHVIIIENKIYAGDQEQQLYRYYETIKAAYPNRTIHVFYLTLFGVSPSKKSVEKLPENIDIHKVSYRDNIYNWIKKCIELAAEEPKLRESLIQYKEVIEKLTNQSETMEERLELYKLLQKEDNILTAFKLQNNWKHIQWHTEWDFLCLLKEKIEKEFNPNKFMPEFSFNEHKLHEAIHKLKKNKYGIRWKIGQYRDADLFCGIERRIDGGMIYGLIIESSKRSALNQGIFNAISPKIDHEVQTSETWAVYSPFSSEIDFQAFSNENTLKLIQPNFRNEIADKCTEELKTLIDVMIENTEFESVGAG